MTTIGLIIPGEMGHAIGNVLNHHGARVITNLTGRGERTAQRAERAGIVDVRDDTTLVSESDVLLSVLAPALATSIAERLVSALKSTGSSLLYVDCNAIAPHTVRPIETLLTNAGSRSPTSASSEVRPRSRDLVRASTRPVRAPTNWQRCATSASTSVSSVQPRVRLPG